MVDASTLTRDWMTVPEAAITGDRHLAQNALEAGRYWTPDGLVTGKRNIDEINALREERGPFSTIYTMELGYDGPEDLKVSLEPLDPETGETIRDPQILLADPETGEIIGPSAELTEAFYSFLKQAEQDLLAKGRKREDVSFFLRESPSKQEKEFSEPPEGMRNV